MASATGSLTVFRDRTTTITELLAAKQMVEYLREKQIGAVRVSRCEPPESSDGVRGTGEPEGWTLAPLPLVASGAGSETEPGPHPSQG